jgi:plastocyanin
VARAARLAPFALGLAVALGAGCAHEHPPTAALQGLIETSAGRHPRTSIEDTVIYLVSESAAAAPVPASHAPTIVTEDDSGLHPTVVAIPVGTRVEFRNRDQVFHMPFSISPAQPFHTDGIAPGESHTLVFDHTGSIHVFCELHPSESAFIYVVPSTRYTRADPHGRFHFWNVAPGPYTLRTWHPELGETSQAVVVPPHGEVKVTVTD